MSTTPPPEASTVPDSGRWGVVLPRLVRLSFCGMPVLMWGGLVALFDPTLGGICAIVGFWLGWQCTEARPERGESDKPNETNPFTGATKVTDDEKR